MKNRDGEERIARRSLDGRDPSLRWLRWLSVAAAILTYCLIVLGSTVRVTNSGMGCPGWPLCSGHIGPIDKFHPLLEQSHRYLASIVTVLILALAALTWRLGPKARFMRAPVIASVAVIAVQIALGAITVVTDNAPITVALHLATGLLFLGIITATAVTAFTGATRSRSWLSELGYLPWAAVVGLFVILISGSLVVDGGAQSACKSWPACSGSTAPAGLIALQLTHRSVVLICGTIVAIYLTTLVRRAGAFDGQRALALAGLLLLAAQVVAGAFDAILGAPPWLADIHLALASALWATVVAVVALTGLFDTPKIPSARALS
ncbi:MAG: COX15/CtaA family protein [Actinobacteria bacterium]|nr:COX15/CtaA family protein [Actinomycetota bacterium]MCL5444584.1 COX15/CtaA family protein [Actinomycetota bacterium]